jgi:hypothetical protein
MDLEVSGRGIMKELSWHLPGGIEENHEEPQTNIPANIPTQQFANTCL